MTVFAMTKATQTYVVPAGVNYLRSLCKGASGAAHNNVGATGGIGGRGAVVEMIHKVTPGATLYVVVGEMATSAYNNVTTEDVAQTKETYAGGGAVYRYRSGYTYGNEGGGYSSVRDVNSMAGTIVLAGGGGGKGQLPSGTNPSGGDASAVGGTGASPSGWGAGKGGSQTAGGAAGTGNASDFRTAGGSGIGGTGGWQGNFAPGGGGGGSGYYGGGGGAADSGYTVSGAGGGGSSYAKTSVGRVTQNLTGASGNTGQGSVTIDPYVVPQPTISFPVAPQVAPRYAFQVDIKDPHPLPTGSRTVTYELSKDSTFATGVLTKTVTFVANGADGKISSDPAIASNADNLHMNFWRPLLDAGTWYVRVKTGGDNSLPDSAWSATANFTVTAYTPPAPSISFPVTPATNRRFAFQVDTKILHPLGGGR